jgi:superfamily II DNA or RNA helicase
LDSVIVTPSKSIFNELLRDFQHHLGKDIVGGYGDGKKDVSKKITIAIGKSLTMLKPGSEAYDFFANKEAMLIDEAHTFAADQLEKVSHGVLNDVKCRAFVSATQTRGDGTEKLLHSIIGRTVLEMSLQEAINDGYLTPLNFTILKTYSPSTKNVRDPIQCKREHFLYNDNIAELCAKLANAKARIKNESTLILVEELVQIQNITSRLEVPYSYVHSSSKKEAGLYGLEKVKLQEEVDKFNEGKVKVLIGTRAIATGMHQNHFLWYMILM